MTFSRSNTYVHPSGLRLLAAHIPRDMFEESVEKTFNLWLDKKSVDIPQEPY
jgi:hypothetical protein